MKHAVRSKISASKKTYTKEELNCKSEEVFNVLELTGFFQYARNIFIYHGLPDEVNTSGFIEKWAAEKNFYLPVISGTDIIFKPYNPGDRCNISAFGTYEPVCRETAKNDDADIIIVPGIAFDRKLNRMGRGKGFYDRFLLETQITKIGICFDFQLFESIPVEQHDIRMDMVVSENELIF